jgi:hypothetical protein
MAIIPQVSQAMQTLLTTTETIAATLAYVKRPDRANTHRVADSKSAGANLWLARPPDCDRGCVSPGACRRGILARARPKQYPGGLSYPAAPRAMAAGWLTGRWGGRAAGHLQSVRAWAQSAAPTPCRLAATAGHRAHSDMASRTSNAEPDRLGSGTAATFRRYGRSP